MADKKLGTMLAMALDPRTPETEAIVALRSLRKINADVQSIVDALIERHQLAQPRRSQKTKWHPDMYGSPFPPGNPFHAQGWDDLRRAAEEHIRARQEQARREAERRATAQQRQADKAKIDEILKKLERDIQAAKSTFNESPARHFILMKRAGRPLAEFLIQSVRTPETEYNALAYAFIEAMKTCGDDRTSSTIRLQFSEHFRDITNRARGHYV